MRTILAALRPLRTELIAVAGLAALLLLAATGVAVRLLAFDLPPACIDPESTAVACRGRQFDAMAYQSFAREWGGAVAYVGAFLPAIAGVILGIAAVAKELDQRTAVLAWSVGPSRRTWMLQRVVPLVGIVALLGLGSTQVFAVMARLQNPGAEDPIANAAFELISVTGFGPLASGVSAFGITVVIGAMLGRLLPGLLAAAVFVLLASILVQQGNERLMANESIVSEATVGAGRFIDSYPRTADGRILGWEEAYNLYADPETGEFGPEITMLTRYVPIEILPQVAARYVLFHLIVGFTAMTLAFVVVERRSP